MIDVNLGSKTLSDLANQVENTFISRQSNHITSSHDTILAWKHKFVEQDIKNIKRYNSSISIWSDTLSTFNEFIYKIRFNTYLSLHYFWSVMISIKCGKNLKNKPREKTLRQFAVTVAKYYTLWRAIKRLK